MSNKTRPFFGQRRLPNRFEIQFDTFKKFTWRERLKILLGYNLVVRVAIKVDKRDGRSWTSCLPALTPLKSEQAVIEQLRKQDIANDVANQPETHP